MSEQSRLEVPRPKFRDRLHALASGLLGQIPLVGSIVAACFGEFFQPALEKRRIAWAEQVVAALYQLDSQQIDLDRLRENPQFVSILVQATQAAVRTHHAEKLDALRYAVISAATSSKLDDLHETFVGLIDQLTPAHLRVLRFLTAPGHWFEVSNVKPEIDGFSTPANLLEHAFPDLRGRLELQRLIVHDLAARQLVAPDVVNQQMSPWTSLIGAPTELGRQFLDFISQPPEEWRKARAYPPLPDNFVEIASSHHDRRDGGL